MRHAELPHVVIMFLRTREISDGRMAHGGATVGLKEGPRASGSRVRAAGTLFASSLN